LKNPSRVRTGFVQIEQKYKPNLDYKSVFQKPFTKKFTRFGDWPLDFAIWRKGPLSIMFIGSAVNFLAAILKKIRQGRFNLELVYHFLWVNLLAGNESSEKY
jgi:hypothetical protein